MSERRRGKKCEPFCRYDDGGDKGFGWRGLRLAIANHTAKTHGCELSVAINPGRGFVFSPVVPVAVRCAEFLCQSGMNCYGRNTKNC